MKTRRLIKLALDDVRSFVNAATRCDFDIDIASNNLSSYIVDAKSIVGVLGLDLGRELIVSYDGYDEEFEKMLNSCAIAC